MTFPHADAAGTVLSGSLLLAVPVALLAGLVSFASPCVLPLVPGYLGYVTGLTGQDPADQPRRRLLAGALLFVAGFSAVFVVIGYVAGSVGDALVEHGDVLTRVVGALTIVMGLLFAGWMPSGDRRVRWRPVAGLAGAPLLGIVFAIGWTPCTGPTLAAIAGMAGTFANPGRAALLAAVYCAGLGLPFLAAALAYSRAMSAFGVLRRHRVAISRAGGGLLVAVGLLLVTGLWGDLVAQAQSAITGFRTAL